MISISLDILIFYRWLRLIVCSLVWPYACVVDLHRSSFWALPSPVKAVMTHTLAQINGTRRVHKFGSLSHSVDSNSSTSLAVATCAISGCLSHSPPRLWNEASEDFEWIKSWDIPRHSPAVSELCNLFLIPASSFLLSLSTLRGGGVENRNYFYTPHLPSVQFVRSSFHAQLLTDSSSLHFVCN